jgi:NAD(P)-dependent dehydrogenase (short-subunit alcohol dehydrogenase family)
MGIVDTQAATSVAGLTIVVTGAARGMGAAIAETLAAHGARVVVADRLESEGAQVTERLRQAGHEAEFIAVDVADMAATVAMADAALTRFGRIDGLVNNAGIYQELGHKRAFDEVEPDEWDRVMAVNARGPWLCIRAVVPHMRSRGRGKIVNVASATVHMGVAGFPHYVASKGALIALTRSLARELGADGITVNAVAPGLVSTEATRRLNESEYLERASRARAIAREMVPSDLAGSVLFLCARASDFVTGQTLIVDGGAVMQ